MKILIIGFSHLGKCLTEKFLDNGWEVIIMDNNFQQLPVLTNPRATFIKGDATKKQVLEKLDISEIQEVFICIEKNEAANLLSCLLLRDRGFSKITAAYICDLQAKALSLEGVNILDAAEETAKLVALQH